MDAVAPPRYLGCGDVRPGPQLRRRRRRLRAAAARATTPTRIDAIAGRGRRRPAAARRRRRAPGSCPRPLLRAGLRRRRRRAARRACAPSSRAHIGADRALAGPRRGDAARPTRASTAPSAATPATGSTAPAPPTSSHRVLRPGGGVVVCVAHPRWLGSDDAPDWVAATSSAVHAALPKARPPATSTGARGPTALERPRRPSSSSQARERARSCTRTDRDGHRRALGLDVVRRRRCPDAPARGVARRARRDARPPRRRRGRRPATAPSCGSLGARPAPSAALAGRRAAAS